MNIKVLVQKLIQIFVLWRNFLTILRLRPFDQYPVEQWKKATLQEINDVYILIP